MNFFRLLALSLFASGISLAHGQGVKTAIFVNNLAGQELAAKTEAFQAMLAGRLNGQGYSILSQQEIADSLEQAPEDERSPANMLATQTSALRLAQLLGADYILVANLVSLGGERRQFSGNGIQTDNNTITLRVAYGLLESAQGGGLEGDSFAVSQTIRNDGNLKVEDSDLINELLQEAAVRITLNLTQPGVVENLPPPASKAEPVTFTITTVLQGIRLPNVLVGPDGQVRKTEQQFPVEANGVDVELDGVIQGSAPGEFAAMPGIHRLRLMRDGFVTWDRNVNLYEGFSLTAAMDLTPAGVAQWKDLTAFLQDLQTEAQLTAARVKEIEGRAQMLRQSGFLVNTTDAPVLNMFNSLWGPPLLNGVPYVEE
ncbi:PEGA domain-containing protein [Rubellicoccus peritrichatus]|uniref:PEGA domain-containing protein n=1 Tax=Rubellicoccus peritrichatus TaxID=3080537 RepID=A0AAQ3LG46_9BACT|nr:PEGA domain-containing protein [Puniceicoccus sp. CR14]WOO41509.1 PEGA domain-containing protein [Puniceicoccus sp. CR14]